MTRPTDAPASEPTREALAELVACKDLKDEESRLRQRRLVAIQRDPSATAHVNAMRADYERRKPLAWAAARAALAAQGAPARDEYEQVFAQHDETGRLWSGMRKDIPKRYAETAAPSAPDSADEVEVVAIEEIAELVVHMRDMAQAKYQHHTVHVPAILTRAAALLETERDRADDAERKSGLWESRAATWKAEMVRADKACQRIAQLERELAAAREVIAAIVSAYDVYRGKGLMPAPDSYAKVVAAIDRAREEKL